MDWLLLVLLVLLLSVGKDTCIQLQNTEDMPINVICNVFSYITQSESCLVYQTGLFWCVLLFQLAEEH